MSEYRRALQQVDKFPGLTATELAAKIKAQASTLSSSLHRGVKKGEVRRVMGASMRYKDLATWRYYPVVSKKDMKVCDLSSFEETRQLRKFLDGKWRLLGTGEQVCTGDEQWTPGSHATWDWIKAEDVTSPQPLVGLFNHGLRFPIRRRIVI